MIVGITGPIASGKSVLSNMLVEKGFIKMSLSDEVRGELRARGMQIERKILQDIGNEMRKKHGNGYWAKRLAQKIDKKRNYVIEGIRNPGEVEELRRLRNFILIGMDAPLGTRLEWIRGRGKDSDPKTIDEIKAIDARDRGVGEEGHGQQSSACFDMADHYITNDSSLADLKEKATELVQQLVG